MTEKEKIIDIIKMAFKTIMPWKKRLLFGEQVEDAYIMGWNDCIKEINKNRKHYIAKLEKL